MTTATVKKTFKDLIIIDGMIALVYQENPALKMSKFGYAYNKFAEKNYYPKLKEFQQALADIRINYALEDKETKEVLMDDVKKNPRGYKYDREGLKKVIKAEDALSMEWDEKEVKIEPYFCKKENLPKLSEGQKELLKGTIIE